MTWEGRGVMSQEEGRFEGSSRGLEATLEAAGKLQEAPGPCMHPAIRSLQACICRLRFMVFREFCPAGLQGALCCCNSSGHAASDDAALKHNSLH